MEHISKLKRLILHLDINKTILMKDSAKFDGSIEKVLLYLISAESWGLFKESDCSWQLATTKWSSEKPSISDWDLIVSFK